MAEPAGSPPLRAADQDADLVGAGRDRDRAAARAAAPAERTLRDHVQVVRRRWLVVVVTAAAAVLAALVLSLLQPTRYSATTEVLVPPPPLTGDAGQQALAQRALDPNRALQDEARLATAAAVLDEVRQRTGATPSVTARTVKDADVLQLTATADTAEAAQQAADATAAVYLQRHNDALPRDAAPAAAATVLHPAPLPGGPSQPSTLRNVLLAAAAGLLLGLLAAYVVDALDDR